MDKIYHTLKERDNSRKKDDPNIYDIIIFCHLRWDFVYQRPQHIISRLSLHYKILVVEEPYESDHNIGYEMEFISSQLTILKPKVGYISDIAKVFETLEIKSAPIVWFYSAAFVEFIDLLKPRTVIYDCMDELSQFKGASNTIRNQEKTLLEQADIVFTGGKSLYEAKSKQALNVYCFPSSVDETHFKSPNDDISIPSDIKNIAQPIVGYIGVIDERIDLELIASTAMQKPEISFVMIGPIAKIEEHDLPRAENIHYLGMKSYGELPHYLKVFKIAMMPFALNEATEYISPTKTLEYMAANKPIISTAIKDVVSDYSEAVTIIKNADEFYQAIDCILTYKTHNQNTYEKILKQTSWDATVSKMMTIIKQETYEL
ncbi:MAG: glycosyltransferase [Gelidibacter sp.]